MKRHAIILVTLAMLASGMAHGAGETTSRRDAARLQAKLDRIHRHAEAKSPAARQTAITETEVNSYLRYELGERIPSGVKDPWVSLLDSGRLAGRAIVDLGEVGRSRKSSSMLDPFNYLNGSLPLAVNGVLRTKNGVGNFVLESVSISGLPVPTWMLQEIVTYYSKSADAPKGVSIDQPFALPAGIREIQLARGQAVVVQ